MYNLDIDYSYKIEATINNVFKRLERSEFFKFYPEVEKEVFNYPSFIEEAKERGGRISPDYFGIPIITGTANDYYNFKLEY